MSMTVRVYVTNHQGIPVAAPEGEIDLATASQYRAQLIAAVPNTAPGLVVDLSGITYLDSRGVQLVLDLADRLRTTQQQLRLVVPERSVIRKVLLLTHVDRTVPIHSDLPDALRAVRADST